MHCRCHSVRTHRYKLAAHLLCQVYVCSKLYVFTMVLAWLQQPESWERWIASSSGMR